MPSIVDVKKALEAVEGGPDLVAALDGELSKLRTESGKYRTRAKTLADHIGVDLSAHEKPEDLESALEALKTKKPEGKKGANDELDARLQRLELDLTAEREARSKAEKKVLSSKAESDVRSSLVKHKALADITDDLVAVHLPSVKFKANGDPYFLDANGAERSVDEHISTWIAGKPGFVSSNQKPGPGGNGNNKSTNADLSKLTPTEKLDMAFGAKE
jgi:hypothetical protein